VEFQDHLGTKVRILTYPDWVALTIGIGFLLSLIAFFFDWKIALSGIIFSFFSIKIAGKVGKTLAVQQFGNWLKRLQKKTTAILEEPKKPSTEKKYYQRLLKHLVVTLILTKLT
jgi:hypothetical protein